MPSQDQSQSPAEFDAFASDEDYEAALNEGLKISGEERDFFAEGRVRWLNSWLGRQHPSSSKPLSCLDFGCGTGDTGPLLLELIDGLEKVVGTDESEASMDTARDRHGAVSGLSFAQASETTQTTQHGIAYTNGVFHHILPDQRPEAARVVFDALEPGGHFAFWENNPWNPIVRLAMARVPFDADAIMVWPSQAMTLLREAGFEVQAPRYLFFFPRFLKLLRPLEPMLARFPMGGQYVIMATKPTSNETS